MNHLVAIVGPTGVGKSRLALRLAQEVSSEIVSADSRQVYRYMNIGTAKPSPRELSLVPHHLIGIVNPDEDFSLARYQQLANEAIRDIQDRGKLPLLVGGSGLYVWSVLEGWEIPLVPPDLTFRRSLEEKAFRVGKDELYRELVRVDPAAAERIDPRNVRRTIRALEVSKGIRQPSQPKKKAPPFRTLLVGLTADRKELYRRTDARVDSMLEQGLLAEVEMLVKKGYDFALPSMSGIGYKQLGMYLRGKFTLEAAVLKTKTETHRFIRHQYAWFHLEDERIHWFDVQAGPERDIEALITGFLGSPRASPQE